MRTQPLLKLPLLLALFSLSLSACDTLECDDGGRLEAAYQQGLARAEAENQADFLRGRTEGLSLTFADGENEGYVAGFDAGYATGYWDSGDYEAGHLAGYGLGFDDGAGDREACEGGDEAGYAEGFGVGDFEGYELGYSSGYDDWDQPCVQGVNPTSEQREADEAPSSKEIGQCHSRGLQSARDSGSFLRGRNEGIAANEEYQAGHTAQYEIGFAAGARDGQLIAYDEGFGLGYGDGFNEGWQSTWFACYDQAFSDGYGAGYDAGYQGGYEEGSYAGSQDAGC